MLSRFIHNLRSLRRLSALAWVLTIAATSLAFRPAHRRSLAARARWLQTTCRSALRALGVSYAATGHPPLTGTVLAVNHLSYLDILVLGATTPTVFVAKSEVRSWPVFGWFARMAGTCFVDRERRGDVARVSQEFAPVLESDLRLVLFLEGTSTDGQKVLPFKSSLLEPAIAAHWPIVPAAVNYSVPSGYSVVEEVCWWGDMTLSPHLFNLAGLPRIQAQVAWGEPMPPTNDRKILASALHHRVTQLHESLKSSTQLPPPAVPTDLTPVLAQS